MKKGKSISNKRVKPSYEDKAATPVVVDNNVKIVVVKAHDGLKVGEEYVKDIETAARMVELGYWKYE